MEKPVLYTHKKQQDRKPQKPDVVVAVQAGLHPASKTVQALQGNNQKKHNG